MRVALGELSVLRPVRTRFPDEVPFEIERIPHLELHTEAANRQVVTPN